MTKVLYISHMREAGGWGQAARDQILALDAAGVEVVCRNVTLTTDKEISGRLLELEKRDSTGCDVCIQHVLPHHIVGVKGFRKNIAFVETETTSIKHLAWFNFLQLVDEVWVPNQQAKDMLDDDVLGRPTKVVHHACEIGRYQREHPPIAIPPAENKFRFYYIGDVNDRKNIESIITSFHAEFEKSDRAILIFKVNKFGKSVDEMKPFFDKIIFDVKQKLRIYPSIEGYMKDVTILGDITDDQICALHRYGDCFMGPSHGEAWSLPAFDAMAFGNTPICSDFGGPAEFIDRQDLYTGALIDGTLTSCKCSDSAFPDMFTARECWFTPNEKHIRSMMRFYYEDWKKDPKRSKRLKQAAGLARAKQFDYLMIGRQMEVLLNE